MTDGRPRGAENTECRGAGLAIGPHLDQGGRPQFSGEARRGADRAENNELLLLPTRQAEPVLICSFCNRAMGVDAAVALDECRRPCAGLLGEQIQAFGRVNGEVDAAYVSSDPGIKGERIVWGQRLDCVEFAALG